MKISEAKHLISVVYETRIPLLLLSSPGIGKSSIVQQFSAESDIGYVEIRASQTPIDETSDIKWISPDGQMRSIPQAWVPTEERVKAGACQEEGVVMLDELADATVAQQAAFCQLSLGGRLGSAILAPGWRVVAASNRRSDKASAGRISTALANRFMIVTVDADVDDSVTYGLKNGWNPFVTSFFRWRGAELLSNFDSKSTDPQFASPRSWEKVSVLLESTQWQTVPAGVRGEILAGLIGQKAALEFNSFLLLYNRIPDLVDIRTRPHDTPVPHEAAIKYALISALLRNLSPQSFDDYYPFVERMEPELVTVFVKDAQVKNPDITRTKSFTKFCDRFGSLIL